ncbi:hypothetical protein [Enterobacter sp.]|uniref:hypothetical protein n=1 Tax=Enterobacter sp. TaxID=42895 RepID=UPI00296F4F40|nr:hypothetical protein [Enterobacter sp.]
MTSSHRGFNAMAGALLGFFGALFITALWVQYALNRVDSDGYQALGVGMIGAIGIPFITLVGLAVGLLEQRNFGPLLRGFAALLAAICILLGIAIIAEDREYARLYGGPKAKMLAVNTKWSGDYVANAAIAPVEGSTQWLCDVENITPGKLPENTRHACSLPDKLPTWEPELKLQLMVRWYREKEGMLDTKFLVPVPYYENKKGLIFVIEFRSDNKACIKTGYEEASSSRLMPGMDVICSDISASDNQ